MLKLNHFKLAFAYTLELLQTVMSPQQTIVAVYLHNKKISHSAMMDRRNSTCKEVQVWKIDRDSLVFLFAWKVRKFLVFKHVHNVFFTVKSYPA